LLFFFVVFLEDFLVVAFFFLAAMALVTSFLAANVRLDQFSVNDFLLACGKFSALSIGAISRACARKTTSRRRETRVVARDEDDRNFSFAASFALASRLRGLCFLPARRTHA
jgi:hypothetical protein